MGRTFRINQKIEIVCDTTKSRTGFKHIAKLFINGHEAESTSINYYNRTWEAYEYQSIIGKLIDKTTALSPQEKAESRAWANGDHTDWSELKAVGMGLAMGDMISNKIKNQNQFKKGVIEAGFGHMGIEFPADWDKLNEKDKKKRFKMVQNFMKPHLGGGI
jgi:hypothetical protein